MQNSFFCNKPYINLYESSSLKSKISSQLLYGEKFKILYKKKQFIKIKTDYDNYTGYIKLSKFINKFRETHKVKVLKSRILKNPNYLRKSKTKKFLPFSSNIEVIKKKKNLLCLKKING